MPKTKIIDRMRRLCSKREYCSADICAKVTELFRKEGGESSPDEIMSSLIADKYIDDLRYAAAFARDKSSLAGWGEAKIRYALAAKKIDEETISAALSRIDSDKAAGRLEQLLTVKLRSLLHGSPTEKELLEGSSSDDLWDLRQKLLRFAISRGYKFEQAERVISRLLLK